MDEPLDDVASRTRAIAEGFAAAEGPGLPILHAVQAAFGHVPQASVPVIAEVLNLSRAEVHGLVSFYHDFRRHPVGGRVVKLCRAEACQAMGAERLAAHARDRHGLGFHETSADGSVTLEAVYCLGLCAAAPCGMVDDAPVARLTEQKLDAILTRAAA